MPYPDPMKLYEKYKEQGYIDINDSDDPDEFELILDALEALRAPSPER